MGDSVVMGDIDVTVGVTGAAGCRGDMLFGFICRCCIIAVRRSRSFDNYNKKYSGW